MVSAGGEPNIMTHPATESEQSYLITRQTTHAFQALLLSMINPDERLAEGVAQSFASTMSLGPAMVRGLRRWAKGLRLVSDALEREAVLATEAWTEYQSIREDADEQNTKQDYTQNIKQDTKHYYEEEEKTQES
jgi:hypothetical protein